MDKIIITGGNGFLGKYIQQLLIENNIEFNILTRQPKNKNEYEWNIENNFIDLKVFDGATAIIHLAGENVGEKRWTTNQKEKILKSRTDSTILLFNYLSKNKHTIETYIGASGSGIYGDGKDEWQFEDTKAGNDFLSNVCKAWENGHQKIEQLGIRTIILRTGVVLDAKNGALKKIITATKYSLGTYFGNGNQFMPWIHIKDIVGIYYFVLMNRDISGIFNAVAPNPVTNKAFSNAVAKQLKKPMMPIGVPELSLKILLGEMSEVLLNSNRCNASKIIDAGYQFEFENLDEAIKNLISP